MLSLTNGGMANECRLPDGSPRESSALLLEWMESAGHGEIAARTSAAAKASAMESFTFLLNPLSFRPTPVDLLPRLLPASEWAHISAGVEQRQRALNLFLWDLYCGEQLPSPGYVHHAQSQFLLQQSRSGAGYRHLFGDSVYSEASFTEGAGRRRGTWVAASFRT